MAWILLSTNGRGASAECAMRLRDTARSQDARYDCTRDETTRGRVRDEACGTQLPMSVLQEQVREVRPCT